VRRQLWDLRGAVRAEGAGAGAEEEVAAAEEASGNALKVKRTTMLVAECGCADTG
jgi:hypothetical protein